MKAVAKERYLSGSETKVTYLQAKTQTLRLKTELHTTKQAIHSLYYKLLAMAGYAKKVSLSKQFLYSVSSKIKRSKKSNFLKSMGLDKNLTPQTIILVQ